MPQVEQVPVAIMFDIDSTLIFVDGAGITAWAHAFRRLHDIDADIEAFTEHVMTDPEVARLTFIGAVGRPATARELTRLLGAYQRRSALARTFWSSGHSIEQSSHRILPPV